MDDIFKCVLLNCKNLSSPQTTTSVNEFLRNYGVNSTGNVTTKEEHKVRYMQFTVVTFVSCMIIGTNVVNLLVLSRTKLIPRIAKISLLNLSASDLMVGLFSCLPCVIPAFTGEWVYGVIWCQIAGIMHGTSVTISIWSLSLVSIDRYLAIVKPFHYHQLLSPKKAKIILLCLWAAAIVTFSSPLVTKTDFIYYQYDEDELICGLYWEYKWFCVITALYIPCASGGTLVFTNTKILATIFARRKIMVSTMSSNKKPRREMKAVKMLLFTSTAYFLAWGPYVAEVVTISLCNVTSIPGIVKFATIWLANSNSFVNVFIYSFMYKSFRLNVKILFCKLFVCCGLRKKRVDSKCQGYGKEMSIIREVVPSVTPFSVERMFPG